MGIAIHDRQSPAAFDVVGRYEQDRINGFSDDLLNRLIGCLDLRSAKSVVDLMAGDGNLTARMYRYCIAEGIPVPRLSCLEYSRVQAEFARMFFERLPVDVIWGDVLEMRDLEADELLESQSFDRAVIKSANHEIPEERQQALYSSVYNLLQPGSLFVNLGFLFDDEAERDELREIARCKDSLAGMEQAVLNRHFLTREEFYRFLRAAGFVDISAAELFDYRISSRIVADQYFPPGRREEFDADFQATQARCFRLRRSGRLIFDADRSLMCCPGEITTARRPTRVEENAIIFRQYPYDYLRDITAHRDLLSAVCRHIEPNASVLDLGCGIGLLAERLGQRTGRYLGIDLSGESIGICKERYDRMEEMSFSTANMNEFDYGDGDWDVVCLVNSLYVEGVDPIRVLEKAYDALRPGGCLVITGPLSPRSFINAEREIAGQLKEDGILAKRPALMAELRRANERLLTDRAHYWSAEGLVELLRMVGFEQFPEYSANHYYGNAYLVVARR